jgi:hypothetical protein
MADSFDELINQQIIDRSVEKCKPALFAELVKVVEYIKQELVLIIDKVGVV